MAEKLAISGEIWYNNTINKRRLQAMSHKKGTDRNQCVLPLTIEEYVEAENPVRLIDEFVNGTNLNKLDGL